MKNKQKKGYSNYENPNSKKNNSTPAKEGSVIVANLFDYEKLPKNVKDHRRESVVVLKDIKEELGVIYMHGKNDLKGNSRSKKKEAGIWEEIKKNGQEVYVDLDIRVTDANGKPTKQGKVFQNTGIIIDPEEMEKVESHLFFNKGRKSHSIRKTISENKDIRDKKRLTSSLMDFY